MQRVPREQNVDDLGRIALGTNILKNVLCSDYRTPFAKLNMNLSKFKFNFVNSLFLLGLDLFCFCLDWTLLWWKNKVLNQQGGLDLVLGRKKQHNMKKRNRYFKNIQDKFK